MIKIKAIDSQRRIRTQGIKMKMVERVNEMKITAQIAELKPSSSSLVIAGGYFHVSGIGMLK